MKSMLSERNFAALLFVMVLIVFAFAHEDSKKRDVFYNASITPSPSIITSAAAAPLTNVAELKQEKFRP